VFRLWLRRLRSRIGIPFLVVGVGLGVGVAIAGVPDIDSLRGGQPTTTVQQIQVAPSTTLAPLDPSATTTPTETTEPAPFVEVLFVVVDHGTTPENLAIVVERLRVEFGAQATVTTGSPLQASYVAASPFADTAAQTVGVLLAITDVRLNALAGAIRVEIGLGSGWLP